MQAEMVETRGTCVRGTDRFLVQRTALLGLVLFVSITRCHATFLTRLNQALQDVPLSLPTIPSSGGSVSAVGGNSVGSGEGVFPPPTTSTVSGQGGVSQLGSLLGAGPVPLQATAPSEDSLRSLASSFLNRRPAPPLAPIEQPTPPPVAPAPTPVAPAAVPATGATPATAAPVPVPLTATEITSGVQDAINNRDEEALLDLLVEEENAIALGEGFQIDAEDRDTLLIKTPERENDGDVFSFKGIAQAAIETGDAEKFAEVVVVAITPEDDAFPEDVDPEELEISFAEFFNNTALLEEIADSDPRTDFVPSTGRRRLACTKCSPVNSWICAHCWPSDACQRLWWCPTVEDTADKKKSKKNETKEKDEAE